MTGDVNFSGKMAKKLNLSDIKVDGLSSEDKAKLDAIFNTKNDGDSKDALTIDEIVKSVANIDTDKNGKLSDEEMKAAWQKLTNKPQGITETQYISYLKAMSAANEQSAKEANIGNGYTIQLGEQLDDLVERVLKSQGVTEPTADQKSKCRQAIIDNNPNSMKIENGTVKWLIAGAKIYLPTDTQTGVAYVKDKDNKAEVEEKYRKWRSGEIASFIYKVGDDGKVYEERNGQRTLAGGGSGSGAVDEDVEAVDMSKIVLIGKITKEDCFDIHDYDKKYDFADVKAKVEKGRDILAKLNNPSSIKECKQGDEKYDNGQVKWYTITFDDDSEVKIHMSEDGNIDGMYSVDSDGNDMIGIYDDGSLWIEMEGSNNVVDVAIRGAVKDFDKVVGLVKQSSKVREAMGLPLLNIESEYKELIIDESKIESADKDKIYDMDKLKSKVKSATDVLKKIATKEYKSINVSKDEHNDEYTVTVNFENGSFAKVVYDKNKKLKEIWIDIDGKKGADNKKHSDVAFKVSGELLLNADNDHTTDITIKDAFKSDDLEKAISKDLLDNVISSWSDEKKVSTIADASAYNTDTVTNRVMQSDKILSELFDYKNFGETVVLKNGNLDQGSDKTFGSYYGFMLKDGSRVRVYTKDHKVTRIDVAPTKDGMFVEYYNGGDIKIMFGEDKYLDVAGAVTNFDSLQKIVMQQMRRAFPGIPW